MFTIKISDGTIISIDSNNLDRAARIQVVNPDNKLAALWKRELSLMYGYRGVRLGGSCAPVDLNAALIKAQVDLEIVEGVKILSQKSALLPADVVY